MMNSENEALLVWLDSDRARAEEAYLHLRRALIQFFAKRRCLDPENLADEVISRVLARIGKGVEIKSDDPRRYVFGAARHVYGEYVREDKKNQETQQWFSSLQTNSVPDNPDLCAEECLARLSAEEREMLERWLLDDDDRMEIEMGVSRNTVRVRIHRIKKKFKECYDGCKKQLSRMK
ncbi:MAG: sigma-70 family RNA polymerase sigma factor [Acidobacteriota bacterium]